LSGRFFLQRVLLALPIGCRHLGLFLGLLSRLLFLNGYCLPVPPTVVILVFSWVLSGSFGGLSLGRLFLHGFCWPVPPAVVLRVFFWVFCRVCFSFVGSTFLKRVCGPVHLLASSGSSSGSFVGCAFLERVLLARSTYCRLLGPFLGLLSGLLFLNGFCWPVPATVVIWVFCRVYFFLTGSVARSTYCRYLGLFLGLLSGSAFLKRVLLVRSTYCRRLVLKRVVWPVPLVSVCFVLSWVGGSVRLSLKRVLCPVLSLLSYFLFSSWSAGRVGFPLNGSCRPFLPLSSVSYSAGLAGRVIFFVKRFLWSVPSVVVIFVFCWVGGSGLLP
jgi:hypothetical protein